MPHPSPQLLKHLQIIAALFAIWALSITIVNPLGDFPLQDDWSYAHSVKVLVENGELVFRGWVAMTLLAQIIWGAVFAWPFDFSFTVLRFSTLTAAFGTLVATYFLLRSTKATAAVSTLAALVMLSNPVFFTVSQTFLTDVPFTALFVSATTFMIAGLYRDSRALVAAGLLIALLAVFVRQLGLALFVSFAVGYLLRRGFDRRNLVVAILPLASALTAYLAYGEILEYLGKLPALYYLKSEQLSTALFTYGTIRVFVSNTFTAFVYIGLFLLPLVLYVLPAAEIKRGRALLWWLLLAALGIAAFAAFEGYAFPLGRNVLFKSACAPPQFLVGPVTLKDVALHCLTSSPTIPHWAGVMLLVMSTCAGAVATFLMLRPQPRDTKTSKILDKLPSWDKAMLIVLVVVYLLPLLPGHLFDRYLIPVLPALMALTVNGARCTRRVSMLRVAPAIALLLTALSFSIVATHDYLEWNRARWRALDYLETDIGATSDEIDGGFEYNGTRNYAESYQSKDGKSWWWVADDKYIVAFNDLPGYHRLNAFAAHIWMPGSKDELLVLKRDE